VKVIGIFSFVGRPGGRMCGSRACAAPTKNRIVARVNGRMRPNETQDQRPSTLKEKLCIVEEVATKCWVRCIAWLGVLCAIIGELNNTARKRLGCAESQRVR